MQVKVIRYERAMSEGDSLKRFVVKATPAPWERAENTMKEMVELADAWEEKERRPYENRAQPSPNPERGHGLPNVPHEVLADKSGKMADRWFREPSGGKEFDPMRRMAWERSTGQQWDLGD